jgi:hypothetical protein
MGTSASFQSSTSQPDVEVRKSQKSNNDGLCLGVEVWEGDLREQAHASDGNGLAAAGLSQRAISDLAEDYTERAYANAQETGGDTRTAELDADLRRRLAEMVLPEFVETEFGRVMAQVFRV